MPNPYPPTPPSSPWPDNSSGQPQSTPGYGGQPTPGYGPSTPGYGPSTPGYGPSTPGYGPSTPGYGGPVYESMPGAVPPPAYAPPPPMPQAYAPPNYPIQPGYAPGYMQYAPVGVPAVGNSGWATASLILGLVGLCTGLAGIAAVICGHIGLNEINRSGGRLGGKGLAIAGLVMGYIEIVGLVLFTLSTFVNIPS